MLAGLCHLFNPVPIWGLFFAGWIHFIKREESRVVVFHARQAAIFHALFLTAALAWLLFGQFCKLLAVILPGVGVLFHRGNDLLFVGVWVAFLTICLIGCARTMSGRPFRYPMLRNR